MACDTKQPTPLILYTGDIALPGGITFTHDGSDLIIEKPQFTLTCISTGGPATTVTWTRDSEIVSGGSITVLEDTATARYIHTLSVNGKLGGLYQCIVSNNMPSSETASFVVMGMFSTKIF